MNKGGTTDHEHIIQELREHYKRVQYTEGDTSQRSAILDLLSEAFGADDMPYYRLQIEHLATPETTFLYQHVQSGELVAHVQVVPYHHIVERDTDPTHTLFSAQRAAYLYAVCTAESQRSRGLMRGYVLPELLDDLRQSGYECAFLIPSSESLVSFYESVSFTMRSGRVYDWIPSTTVNRVDSLPCSTPLLYPGVAAQSYLRAISDIGGATTLISHPVIAPQLLTLAAGWMTRPLSSDLQDYSTTVLVAPLL